MIQRTHESEFEDERDETAEVNSRDTPPPYHRPHDPFVIVPADDQTGIPKKQLSLRRHRRNFTVAVTAFTVGTLFIICSTEISKEFLVPGPLSSHHAPLVASEGGARCASCHANASGSLTGWIAGVFTRASHTSVSQSELCMKCHDQSLDSRFAFNPHNVAAETLSELTAAGSTAVSTPTKTTAMGTHSSSAQIACSVCHQEHHGGKNLATLTDLQCQSCHSRTFHSFENGHPEFVNYPLQRRARIAFDHASHAVRHFPEKQTEFTCSQCHIDDAFQNVKQMASFEQSCAACHNQQILDSNSQGLAIIALPLLDMSAFEAAGIQVGGWPLAATGDFDGKMPPMMRLLLTADPDAKTVLARRGPDFEFFDLDADQHNDVTDAAILVWSIKKLLFELASGGPAAIQQRLQDGLGFEISDAQLQRIITNLDGPVFQNAVNSWLPQLPSEIAGFNKVAIQTNPTLEMSETLQLTRPTQIPKTTIDWLPGSNDVVMNREGEGNLLAENPLTKLMAGQGTGTTKKRTETTPIAQTPPTQVDSPDVGVIQTESPTSVPQVPKQDDPPPTALTENQPQISSSTTLPMFLPSGWYRNDQSFRISYRPSGHADDCLQSWIELVTRATDAHMRPETKQLFEKTISMTGVGLCRTCHTVDQMADRSFAVNWVAKYRDPSIRSFTKFAHGSHLLQPELKDCSHCHRLDLTKNNAESFLSTHANEVNSNFSPTSKNDCVSCHQKSRTNSSCTQCHNYHVGSHVIGER